jgi:hypothetical protein
MAQYRYSAPHFRRAVLAAVAMTAMVAGVVWMVTKAAARPDALFWAGAAALLFFAFISVGMLQRYARNAVVLAVRPTGLYDARYASRTIPWDEIKDIILRQHENEFELEVYLWKLRRDRNEPVADFLVDLAQLDDDPERIVNEISAYKPVSIGGESQMR